MKKHYLPIFILGLLSAGASPAFAADRADDLSLRKELNHEVDQSLTFLAKEQNLDGYWATPDFPGLTALVVRSFVESPVDNERWTKSDAVAKGIAFIKANVHEDGGIYNRGLYSYNTAISLMCLNAYAEAAKKYDLLTEAERAELREIMVRAREYVVGQQQFYSKEDFEQFNGGIGYGDDYKHSDLSNTSLAIQALHETRDLVEADDETPVTLDWDAAIQFITNTQNLPETNKLDWASGDPENRGGFIYSPGDSQAGTFEKPDGGTGYHSYGSMSYAGLMSFLYAGLDKDDERVLAAVDWLTDHFDLEENPGMGPQGRYYYYYTMANALDAYGKDILVLEDGTEVDWRRALAEKLVSLYEYPGFWVNENSRWMESNPYLVSAYTLLAIKHVYPKL